MLFNVYRPWLRLFLLTANLFAPVSVLLSDFESPWINAAAAIAHASLIYAIVAPGCAWLGPVVTRFHPRGREVWLTIDDGPAGAETEYLAKELQSRGVRATFFVKGNRLEAQRAQADQLHAAGHTLANHTQTHPASMFWWLFPSTLREELDACDAALLGAGVAVRRWFRAPVGLKHVFLHRELAARDMRLIGWNVRGRDGIASDPEAVVKRVLRQVRPGAIVVLHEGKKRSVEGILRVIEELQSLGYAFVIPSDEQLI
ncbi:MAG: acetyl xylan esterase [Chthoniobacteraceae bacterium]|nr:acetyl xylan esterase [Chthoniobacteraceae bacterium]